MRAQHSDRGIAGLVAWILAAAVTAPSHARTLSSSSTPTHNAQPPAEATGVFDGSDYFCARPILRRNAVASVTFDF